MRELKTIESYLEQVGRQRQSSFGRRFRHQFRDTRGTAELAMLAAPSEQEFDDFRKVVEVMTEAEKDEVARLDDEQIKMIADRAGADPGNAAIFLNGYILQRKKIREEI